MIEYISGMKLIKAYNMGSKSFQKFSDAIQEENAMWNETSRRMGPPYACLLYTSISRHKNQAQTLKITTGPVSETVVSPTVIW